MKGLTDLLFITVPRKILYSCVYTQIKVLTDNGLLRRVEVVQNYLNKLELLLNNYNTQKSQSSLTLKSSRQLYMVILIIY